MVVQVNAVFEKRLGLQMVGGQVLRPRLFDLDHFATVLGCHLVEALVHELAPLAVDKLPGLVCVGAPMVGHEDDLGGRSLPGPSEAVFVAPVVAIDVEDQQVGVEGVQVLLGCLDQNLAGEAAEGSVLDVEVGLRETPPQVVGDELRPLLFRDGLTVEQHAHLVAPRRRAGGQQRHGSLDVLAPAGAIRGRRRRRVRLGGSGGAGEQYEGAQQAAEEGADVEVGVHLSLGAPLAWIRTPTRQRRESSGWAPRATAGVHSARRRLRENRWATILHAEAASSILSKRASTA